MHSPDSPRAFRISLALFFGSGICALAYETIWVRQLTFTYGISVYAISAVLSAFMFGLCAGSYLLGRWSPRIRNPLRTYACFELAIALYSLLLYWVLAELMPPFYRTMWHLLPDVPWFSVLARFVLTFVLLAVPTTLMGGTLPVLARYLQPKGGTIGSSLGLLYGINTLGALFGTALAGFWMLQNHGIRNSTLLVFGANVGIAVLAWIASRNVGEATAEPEPAVAAPVDRPAAAATLPLPARRLVVLVLFLSGFTALSYEVIWNRSLLLYTHSSTYAFSTILIVFLLGVSLGSMLYAKLPPRMTGLRTLGVLQLAIAGYVWASFHFIGKLPAVLERVMIVTGTDSFAAAMATIFTAAALVVFVPTVLMGMTFPLGTALSTADGRVASSATGRAYAFLTLGNILGSLVTGFFLIGWLGLRTSFAVGIALNLLGGSLLLLWRPSTAGAGAWARVGASLATAGLVLLAFLRDVPSDVFRTYYEDYLGKLLFYKEEVTDNVMVHETAGANPRRWVYYSDGRGTAGNYTNKENRRSGHIPMLLHPDPKSVLSVCFGVGNTLSALAKHAPDRLVCVELSPGAFEAAPWFPTNQDVLETTPGLELVVEDGRNYMLRTDEKFDVIQLEPPELHQATVVNLYTREFYEMCRDRLNDGGIICQWYTSIIPEWDQRMVVKAFLEVFPNGSLWQSNWASFNLVAGKQPIRISPALYLEKAARPEVAEDLRSTGITPMELLGFHLLGPESLAAYAGDVPPVTDDRTFVDFNAPRSMEAGFGVFKHNNALHFKKRPFLQVNFALQLRLEEAGETPYYLFDFDAVDPELAARFRADLEQAKADHKRVNTARLRDRLDQ